MWTWAAVLLLPVAWARVGIELGLSDAAATVGKLFLYTIPEDAFWGAIDHYEVKEAGGSELPAWLVFRASHGELVGIPAEGDIGPVFVSITAVSPINATHGHKVSDVFSVTVRDDVARPLRKLPVLDDIRRPDLGCGVDESVVSENFLLDVPFPSLSGEERVRILEAAAFALHKPIGNLRLFADDYVRSLQHTQLYVRSVDPGNEDYDKGTYVVLRLGCGSELGAGMREEVEGGEEAAVSGHMAALIGYPILSLRVAAGKLSPVKRKRQSGYVTATPALAPTPATNVPQIRRLTNPPTTTPTSTAPTTPPRTTKVKLKMRTRPTTTTPLPPPIRKPNDKPPRKLNSMPTLNCYINRICSHSVPADLFRDDEDRTTTFGLNLSLEPNWNVSKTSPSFMFLGQRQRHIFGLQSVPGVYEYRIGARDSSNQLTVDAFRVKVLQEMRKPKFNHEFSVRLGVDYPIMMGSVEEQVKLVRRLATYFRDSHSEALTITAWEEGSTVLKWANNTLPFRPCPSVVLQGLRELMVSEDGRPTASLKKHMGREFPVLGADLVLRGPCDENSVGAPAPTTPRKHQPTQPPKTTNAVEESTMGPTSNFGSADLWITTILPILIICVLLLIALIVACCLYRRSRKSKAANADDSGNAFVSKGAPVIFEGEVEMDDKDILATTPMLVKEERAPLPSPDVPFALNNRAASHGGETHELAERVPLNGTRSTRSTEHENPLYRPPPPLHPQARSSPRPTKHSLPHQREPPPYVPP